MYVIHAVCFCYVFLSGGVRFIFLVPLSSPLLFFSLSSSLCLYPPHSSLPTHTHFTMSSMLKKAVTVSIPSVRQALLRSNPVLANALLAKRSYNSKGGVEVITTTCPSSTKITHTPYYKKIISGHVLNLSASFHDWGYRRSLFLFSPTAMDFIVQRPSTQQYFRRRQQQQQIQQTQQITADLFDRPGPG